MAGEADVRLKLSSVGDLSKATDELNKLQRELSESERENEKLKISLKGLESQIVRTATTKRANPLANMSGGTVGDGGMAAGMSRLAQQQRIDSAVKLHQIRKTEQAAVDRRKEETDAINENALAVDHLAAKVVGLGVAYKAVSSAVTSVIAKNEEFLGKLDQMGQVRADEELKLQIQGGLLPEDISKNMPQIERAVRLTPSVGGSTPAEMYANTVSLATQLASSNVKDPEALNAVLQLKAGTNRFGRGIGGDAADVRSLIQFTKGVGILEPKANDLVRIGGGIAEVFEASDLQFSDISHLSPHAATLKSLGMNEMAQLAAFANLTDVQGSELSGRGLKMVGLRLATAKETEASGKALAELGLTPDDVAIAEGGRSMTESMRLLRDKLAPIEQTKKNRLVEEIFGHEAIGIANTLLAPGRLEQIDEWTEKARQAQGFQTKVRTFQESRYARDRANIAATGFSLRRHDINTGERTWQEHTNELEAIRTRDLEGRSAPARAFLNFGAVVEDFANWAFFKSHGATPTEAGYESPSAKEQTRLLERIAVGVERRQERPINRNGQVEDTGY